MSEYRLLHGDALAVLKTLPSESVHVCVTSPPYYSLRDYGTATWDGGDPDCDHRKNPAPFSEKALAKSTIGAAVSTGNTQSVYKSVCGKCGARRVDQQLGLEDTPDAYVARLVEVFREVRRVLHKTGTVWINLGDSYNGSGGAGGDYAAGGLKDGQPKYPGRNVNGLGPKQLLGIPWRVAFALQADGWVLRSEIIWHKKAPMPESVTDRPTKAHEQVFLLAKSASYYYDAEAIREPYQQSTHERMRYTAIPKTGKVVGMGLTSGDGNMKNGVTRTTLGLTSHEAKDNGGRNKRSVWTLGPESYSGAHFAVMPTKLVEPCILAGSSSYGACAKCGSPYERVVEHSEPIGRTDNGNGDRHVDHGMYSGRAGSRINTTTGWAATCQCGADVVPCTVLDPFSGAGTVGVVAMRHHRRYIGIDLNESYNELARRRIEQVQPTLFSLETT